MAGVQRGRRRGVRVWGARREREARSEKGEGERLPWRYCFFHTAPKVRVICLPFPLPPFPDRASRSLLPGSSRTSRFAIEFPFSFPFERRPRRLSCIVWYVGTCNAIFGLILNVRTCETRQWRTTKNDQDNKKKSKTKKHFTGSYTEVNANFVLKGQVKCVFRSREISKWYFSAGALQVKLRKKFGDVWHPSATYFFLSQKKKIVNFYQICKHGKGKVEEWV